MTIKQVLIGVVLGSSVVGLMVHRMHQAKDLEQKPKLATSKILQHKEHAHRMVALPKPALRGKDSAGSEVQLSSRRLFGKK